MTLTLDKPRVVDHLVCGYSYSYSNDSARALHLRCLVGDLYGLSEDLRLDRSADDSAAVTFFLRGAIQYEDLASVWGEGRIVDVEHREPPHGVIARQMVRSGCDEIVATFHLKGDHRLRRLLVRRHPAPPP
jgi:hypothetical protein